MQYTAFASAPEAARNGWIMTAAALLADNAHPSDAEIKDAFATLICRCGTHGAALRAVKRAAQAL